MSEERRRACIRIVDQQRELNKEREDLDRDIRELNNEILESEAQITELERRERSLQTPSIPLRRSPGRGRRRYPDEEGAQLQVALERSRELEQVRSKLQDLRRQQDTHKAQLKKKTLERDGKIRNIYEMERRYGANNCPDFPETVGYSRRSF